MNSKAILGISLAAVFAVSMISAITVIETEAAGNRPTSTFLVQESAILDGFAGAYPFIDTTPKQIIGGHVAITDSTDNCELAAEEGPNNIVVLVGDAEIFAISLANEDDPPEGLVEVPWVNTGIGDTNSCVFHADIDPADLELDSFTDIVVAKSELNDGTVTVTAEVAQ